MLLAGPAAAASEAPACVADAALASELSWPAGFAVACTVVALPEFVASPDEDEGRFCGVACTNGVMTCMTARRTCCKTGGLRADVAAAAGLLPDTVFAELLAGVLLGVCNE